MDADCDGFQSYDFGIANDLPGPEFPDPNARGPDSSDLWIKGGIIIIMNT